MTQPASPALLTDALAHPTLQRLQQRLAQRVPQEAHDEGARTAAVVAVLRVREALPELLFIKRADRAGDPWSGHMAFPGGRHEPADTSLEMTAVRETWEEVALDLRVGRLLGRLDDLAPRNVTLPPIVIRPYVAVVPHDVTLVPSEEVAATFWMPIDRLGHADAQAEYVLHHGEARARFPAFRVQEHIVWGLTERIVRQLLPLLEP